MIAFLFLILFVVAGIWGFQVIFGLEFAAAANLFGMVLMFLIGLIVPDHPQYRAVKQSPQAFIKYTIASVVVFVFSWALGMLWDGWLTIRWISAGVLALSGYEF